MRLAAPGPVHAASRWNATSSVSQSSRTSHFGEKRRERGLCDPGGHEKSGSWSTPRRSATTKRLPRGRSNRQACEHRDDVPGRDPSHGAPRDESRRDCSLELALAFPAPTQRSIEHARRILDEAIDPRAGPLEAVPVFHALLPRSRRRPLRVLFLVRGSPRSMSRTANPLSSAMMSESVIEVQELQARLRTETGSPGIVGTDRAEVTPEARRAYQPIARWRPLRMRA